MPKTIGLITFIFTSFFVNRGICSDSCTQLHDKLTGIYTTSTGETTRFQLWKTKFSNPELKLYLKSTLTVISDNVDLSSLDPKSFNKIINGKYLESNGNTEIIHIRIPYQPPAGQPSLATKNCHIDTENIRTKTWSLWPIDSIPNGFKVKDETFERKSHYAVSGADLDNFGGSLASIAWEEQGDKKGWVFQVPNYTINRKAFKVVIELEAVMTSSEKIDLSWIKGVLIREAELPHFPPELISVNCKSCGF